MLNREELRKIISDECDTPGVPSFAHIAEVVAGIQHEKSYKDGYYKGLTGCRLAQFTPGDILGYTYEDGIREVVKWVEEAFIHRPHPAWVPNSEYDKKWQVYKKGKGL